MSVELPPPFVAEALIEGWKRDGSLAAWAKGARKSVEEMEALLRQKYGLVAGPTLKARATTKPVPPDTRPTRPPASRGLPPMPPSQEFALIALYQEDPTGQIGVGMTPLYHSMKRAGDPTVKDPNWQSSYAVNNCHSLEKRGYVRRDSVVNPGQKQKRVLAFLTPAGIEKAKDLLAVRRVEAGNHQ